MSPWRVALIRRLAWPMIAVGVLAALVGFSVLCHYVMLMMHGLDPGFHALFSGLSPLAVGSLAILFGLRARRLKPDDTAFFVDRDPISPKQAVFLRRTAWPLIAAGVLGILSGFGMLFIHFLAVALELDMEMDLPFRALFGFAAGAFVIFLGLRMRSLRPNQTGLFVERDAVSPARAALLGRMARPLIALGVLTIFAGFGLLIFYLVLPMQDIGPGSDPLRALFAVLAGGFVVLVGKELRRLSPNRAA